MVAMIDSEMKYIAVSDRWKTQFGLENLAIEGRSHYELFPDTPPVWKQYHQRAMAGEPLHMDEDSVTGMDGHTEWMQWEISPWYDDDNRIGGIMVFIIMISEKHAAKQKLIHEKDQAQHSAHVKSSFLSVMSHEMRTPLNGVIGFINLLLQDPRPDQLENMNVLKFSAENLLVLINNVLDFSKLDADKVELEEAGFSLVPLLENITASLRLEASTKNLDMDLTLDDSIPPYLTGDPGRLGQILINLLSNAIKFTHSGKVSLTAKVVSQYGYETTIAFAVEDTGIGIPVEIQKKIFDSFSQADTHTTRKYGGSGLGLTISKRLAELMGSSIQLESQPGQGSLFSFKVVFKNFDESLASMGDQSHTGSQILQNARILIAEDHLINVLVVKKFLLQWRCIPSVAENGLVAFEMVKKEDYDLVLMDLQMPVMDGYEATTQIRSLPDEKYKQLPIIALTASSVVNRKSKIFQAGMNDLISKPFEPDRLQHLMALHLARKRYY
jgi:PAS domain S-box-containing protein